MRKRLVFLLILAACGGSKSSGPGQDWSGKPLEVKVEDKVNDVAFTIMMPKGMKLDGDAGPGELTKQWEADLKDQWSEPTVMVAYASIPAKDITEFIRDAMIDDDIIAKQETTADGFVLIHHSKNKGLVTAEVMKTKGEHHLTCRASQAKDGGIPNPDKTIPWLESVCASLTIL